MKPILTTILTAALALTAFAQSPNEIKARRENQQDRIANGVGSGQLTAGETSRLEKRETRINGEIARDRKANGGNLTNNEKKQVNQQLNNTSKQIYADKHNATQQKYGNNQVDGRRENQQDRIAQGIKSGQLTARETSKLERQETRINRQVHADRKANGGNLTNNQKAQVNGELNKESGRIYNKKHN